MGGHCQSTNAPNEVAISVYDFSERAVNDGSVATQKTLRPGEVWRFNASDVDAGYRSLGSASIVIRSKHPVRAIAENINSSTGDAGPYEDETLMSYNGANRLKSELYFPTFWSFGGAYSRMRVANALNEPTRIDVVVMRRDGTQALQLVKDLAPRESFTLSGREHPLLVPASRFIEGSVIVRQRVAGNFAQEPALTGMVSSFWRDGRAAAYQALSDEDLAEELSIPSHFRLAEDRSDPVTCRTWKLYSASNIMNPNASRVPVEIEYVTRSTADVVATLRTEIPAKSATGANTNNGGNFTRQDFVAVRLRVLRARS